MLASLAIDAAAVIAPLLNTDAESLAAAFIPPTKAGAGDLALPCFPYAKALQQAPPQVATRLAEAIEAAAKPGVRAEAAGPFLNLHLDTPAVAAALLSALAKHPEQALRRSDGKGQKVCIDFSSPNIAKHLAFHHIRSTMIGNALSLCYEAAGWDVERINFLGDWGTAFGRLIAGWHREGLSLADLDAADDPVTFINELYVRISQAAKQDPQVMDEARAWSKKLEDGDATARELWQLFKDVSLKEFQNVYDLLNVRFDSWRGEAYYEDKMGPTLAELEASGLTTEDDGALIVDLSSKGFKKPCLLKRSDGGTLYATRDLAACQDRYDTYAFDRSLYVVDNGQNLHFREWFAVADLLNKPYAKHLRHIAFGVVLMWNEESDSWEKTATRNGVPRLLREVLEESINRAEAIIAEKNPELPEEIRRSVAKDVGVGAVVFNDLKNNRKGDVKFRFDDALNMQGDTGPYLQFAHARLCSILRKASATPQLLPAHLTRDDEKAVLLNVARLPSVLKQTVEKDDPSQLATGLLNFAGTISSWLTAGGRDASARVLCDDQTVQAARLHLVATCRDILAEGLRLLGLGAPEQM
jgi:arginyl-tRNA synthetase